MILGSLPDGQFAAPRIDEMESPAPWEGKDWLGDDAPCLHHRIEGGVDIVDPDDRQRCRNPVAGIALQAKVDIARGRR